MLRFYPHLFMVNTSLTDIEINLLI